MPPACALVSLRAGDAVEDAAGRLVYVPEPDYFNRDWDDNQLQDRSAIEPYTDAAGDALSGGAEHLELQGEDNEPQRGDNQLPGAHTFPDIFDFRVVDAHGLRSANASHAVWP